MVHGILIPASDAEDIQAREYNALEDYQAAVGGWIEAVDLPDFDCTMFVNEEGLLDGLPYNRRATFLWWYHVPQARGKARLVGDVAVVGLPDGSGRATSLQPESIELLLGRTPCHVELRNGSSGEWRPEPRDGQAYVEAIVWAVLVQNISGSAARVRSAS